MLFTSRVGRDPIGEFVQDVQDSFTVLTLSDKNAGKLFEGGEIWLQVPHPLIFEILVWTGDSSTPAEEEKFFVPYVSRRLDELLENDQEKQAAWDRLSTNSKEMFERPDELKAHLAGRSLRELLGEYRAVKVPTNTAASAVVYLAWEQGFLHKTSPNSVRDAFFLKGKGSETTWDLVVKMATKVYPPLAAGAERLPDSRVWLRSADESGFSALIEYSLIHKLRYKRKVENWYLVHYPLIIDSYWFVGFAYFLDHGEGVPRDAEAFLKSKYNKCRALLTSLVAEPLRESLYRVALSGMEDLHLLDGRLPFREVYLYLLRKLFPCFDFFVSEDKSYRSRSLLHKIEVIGEVISEEISVYGPAWILGASDALGQLSSELDKRKHDLLRELEGRRKREEDVRRSEAQRQIERWAHNMQHKLRPAVMWAERLLRSPGSGENRETELLTLGAQLEVLQRTTQTLSRYWRVESSLLHEKDSVIGVWRKGHSPTAFEVLTRGFGHLLFEVFLQMTTRLVGKDEEFEQTRHMRKFILQCTRWLPGALSFWKVLRESGAALVDISRISGLADGREFQFIATDVDFGRIRIWKGFNVAGVDSNSDFRCDIAVGMVLDNMLSNAFKFVQKVEVLEVSRHIEIEVTARRVEEHPNLGFVDFKVINTASRRGEEGRDLLEEDDFAGHGLVSCRDIAVLLSGNREHFVAYVAADGMHVISRFQFPVTFLD